MSQKTMRRANILSGAALSLLFSLIPRASAQGTNATCVAGFEWVRTIIAKAEAAIWAHRLLP